MPRKDNDITPNNGGWEDVPAFDCEVRLGGDMLHTIWKRGITQKELTILRAIHGKTSIVNVSETGRKLVNPEEEYFELAHNYDRTTQPMFGVKLVEQTFKVNLDGYSEWNNARMEAHEDARMEYQRKANQEAARLSHARDVAEYQERTKILEEQVRI